MAVNYGASSSFSRIAPFLSIVLFRARTAPPEGRLDSGDPIDLCFMFLKQLLQKRPAGA
jgi:hypothetical protein